MNQNPNVFHEWHDKLSTFYPSELYERVGHETEHWQLKKVALVRMLSTEVHEVLIFKNTPGARWVCVIGDVARAKTVVELILKIHGTSITTRQERDDRTIRVETPRAPQPRN